MDLLKSKDHVAQIFVLEKGRVNLTSGSVSNPAVVHCVVAGNIVVTWWDGTTSTIALVEGDRFGFKEVKSVAISTGTYHLMV